MRIGICGAGQMGGYYANNLVNKCGFPAADVVCFDILPERPHALAQKYGVTVAESFPSGVDAAIVATNTPSHHDVVSRLVRQGVKHILCEKPLAQTPKDARLIAAGAGDSNIYMALVINFSPALKYFFGGAGGWMGNHDVEIIDFYGRWGKNRGASSEKRPTAGDLEDEAVHVIGVLLAFAKAGGRKWKKVTAGARVGWLPFVNEVSQRKAAAMDPSFPEQPNHSTSANLRFTGGSESWELGASVYSSFLLPQETRLVGGLLGRGPHPIFGFEVQFDQKRPEKTGGAVDILKVVNINENKTVIDSEFSGDKLNDLTKAFLTAAGSGGIDSRLTSVDEAVALVDIADAILRSDASGGIPQDVRLRL